MKKQKTILPALLLLTFALILAAFPAGPAKMPVLAANTVNTSSPAAANETAPKESEDEDQKISPVVIAAVLILPLLSIGLTIGTAVIMIQYRKSHPSKQKPEDTDTLKRP